MESKGKVSSSSSSSLTAELFGVKESPSSSSTGIFASIFPSPSEVLRRNSLSSKNVQPWQKQPLENQAWNVNQVSYPEKATYDTSNMERNSIYQEEKAAAPCHLSSSLYYGGQDMYSHSPSTQQNSASYPMFNKDGREDDANGTNFASRGNWWQGTRTLAPMASPSLLMSCALMNFQDVLRKRK